MSQSFPHLPVMKKRELRLILKQEKLQLDTRMNFLFSGRAELAVMRFSAGRRQNDRLREERGWNTER